MGETEVRPVTTARELKQFIEFPFRLYRGNPYWVPPLRSDEANLLRSDKNPAFEYCESAYWMAWRNGEPAGRIAAIINHKELERWNNRLVRFGWFDFIDDPEISRALIDAAWEWGRAKGMTGMHGPLGFTDMDPEGMLIEGFDEISSLSALYNYPYYASHMEAMGFRKAVDWVQFEMVVPASVPDKIVRINRLVLQRYDLRLLRPEKARDILPYAAKLFAMYNESFHDIYGFTALTEKQIREYTRQYFGFIRPEFVSMVIDSSDNVVGFGICIPSLSRALQKANGSLFPFGFIHLLRALRKNEVIHMYLVGVHPEYQGKGVLALVYQHLTQAFIDAGIKIARTHPQLEENVRATSIWKNYDSRVYIRRRCWIREWSY